MQMQMQMRSGLFLTMSPLLLFIISTFIILIHNFPMCHGVDDEQFTNCNRSYTCANREISYPFWGGDRPNYCGYPGFELNCSGDAPEITMASLSYRVLEIDNSAATLTLVRNDYWQTLCPPSYANVTLDFSVLTYASNTKNVSLYYECLGLPTGNALPTSTRFNCGGNISYYLTPELAGGDAVSSALLLSCNSSVRVPAVDSAVNSIETNISTENVMQVIDAGFSLEWEANNTQCQRCTGSGGTCGSQPGTTEFTCYCPGGPNATICDRTNQTTAGNNKSDVSLGVGLGIAGAGIVGLGLGFLFFRYRQRRKQLDAEAKSKDLPTPPSTKGIPTPTTQFTRSIPSFPSSNTDFAKSNYFGVQVFDYTELEEATDNFNPSRELGDGGFGTVYYGNLLDGRVVAVKRLYENNFKRVEQFMNEVEILTRLRHKNLVVLFGCTSRKSRELLLVYEYIPNGTVADHLHGSKSNSGLLTWSVRLSIAIETADALAYLHASDIIHRDVKTNNILLDNDFRVKVADFGLSRLFPTDVTHVSTAPQGTPGYVDPEYYQCYQLTDKSDVYSFGVVLMELISSKPAVDTNRHRHDINLANMAVNKIQNHTLHELVEPSLGFETDYVVKRMTTAVAELAFRCLQQEKDMRPSMEEVLEGLRAIQNEDFSVQKAEVVDIRVDEDAGLLKNIPNPPPLSPDSAATDKWVSSSTTPNSF